MLLSKLVYLCVKNAIYYDDASFTYEQFLQGRYDGDPDYATNINNAFGPINEAIMRLGDLERIPHRLAQVQLTNGTFSKSSMKIRSIVAVATMVEGKPYPLNFYDLGNLVSVPEAGNGYVLCEYKEDIPNFDSSSYEYEYVPNSAGGYSLSTSRDVDLSAYGITEAMCSAIVEYAKGNLNEQVAAELANMHLTRAEQYFANIEPAKSVLKQERVRRVNRIGE